MSKFYRALRQACTSVAAALLTICFLASGNHGALADGPGDNGPSCTSCTTTCIGAPKNTTCDGNPVCVKDSNFKMSTGDEAGSAGGGVASNKIKGKAEFVNYSFDVKIEGKNVPRAFDLMLHNDKNTPPFPVLQQPIVAMAEGEDPELQEFIKVDWA